MRLLTPLLFLVLAFGARAVYADDTEDASLEKRIEKKSMHNSVQAAVSEKKAAIQPKKPPQKVEKKKKPPPKPHH
jgi:hypothetical protein